MSKRKRNKTRKVALYIIGAIIIVLFMVLASFLTYKKVNLNIDDNVIKENDDNETKMDIAPGGGAASLQYSNQVAIDRKSKEVSLYLKNSTKSRENVSIQIYLNINNEELLIAESEIVPTGYLINKLTLENVNINEGDYKGYIKVSFYNEETNKKEIVDSKINIKAKVN